MTTTEHHTCPCGQRVNLAVRDATPNYTAEFRHPRTQLPMDACYCGMPLAAAFLEGRLKPVSHKQRTR
ncbi:MAG: hypothetical protein RLN67_13845 [Algiphilus sp.]|uniref:hypothetical protein n=1 Tax=Algiphilus sp. TaxID=1872431 RepID=UPI0032EB0EF1